MPAKMAPAPAAFGGAISAAPAAAAAPAAGGAVESTHDLIYRAFSGCNQVRTLLAHPLKAVCSARLVPSSSLSFQAYFSSTALTPDKCGGHFMSQCCLWTTSLDT